MKASEVEDGRKGGQLRPGLEWRGAAVWGGGRRGGVAAAAGCWHRPQVGTEGHAVCGHAQVQYRGPQRRRGCCAKEEGGLGAQQHMHDWLAGCGWCTGPHGRKGFCVAMSWGPVGRALDMKWCYGILRLHLGWLRLVDGMLHILVGTC